MRFFDSFIGLLIFAFYSDCLSMGASESLHASNDGNFQNKNFF